MFFRIGHRGAGAYERENTLESFAKAAELGANALEIDVRQTKDGGLIVFHDDSLKRTFGIDAKVQEMTLKELHESTESKVPMLDEALEYAAGKFEKIFIELKERGHEKKVLASVRKYKITERAVLISFHEEVLEKVRKLDRKIETGLIYARHKNPLLSALRLKVQYILPLYRFIHRKNIEDAHRHNLKVIVWTINTIKEAEAYVAKGVDGIASDRPDILKDIKGLDWDAFIHPS